MKTQTEMRPYFFEILGESSLADELTKWFEIYRCERLDENFLLDKCLGMAISPTIKTRLTALVKLLLCASQPTSVCEQIIDSPDRVWEHFSSLRYEESEKVVAIYLGVRQELILSKTIALGSYNQVHLRPLDVLRPAVLNQAKNVILIHNHPSGGVEPSEDDLVFTKKCQRAFDLLGIRLVDHLVFGKTKYFSFKRAGLL